MSITDRSSSRDSVTIALTDEQIDKMYAPTDFSGQKKLALAQFGFGLMRPTEKGRIGAAIAPAGAQLAQDLSKINLRGKVICLESTVYPGATNDLVKIVKKILQLKNILNVCK